MKTKQQKKAHKRAARNKFVVKPLEATPYIRKNIVLSIVEIPKGFGDANPLGFGNMGWSPEVIISNDLTGKGIQVHPRYPTADYLAKHPELMFKEVPELKIIDINAKSGWFDNKSINPDDMKTQLEDSMVRLRAVINKDHDLGHALCVSSICSDTEMVFRRDHNDQLEQLYVNVFDDQEKS